MKIKNKNFAALGIIVFLMQFLSSAHYIVGIVNDALDLTSANDFEVVLWNPVNGISDNLTDIVGMSGNSGVNNFYLIDCEMLDTACDIGDTLNVKIFSYPYSANSSVIVTGAGFDLAENITLNSPPDFLSIIVEDSFKTPVFPENEIDLISAGKQNVVCEAIIEKYDRDELQNIRAEFFDYDSSFFGDSNNNNTHYTNSSCFVNESYGSETETQVLCGFEVWYNANFGTWNCTMFLEDNLSANNTYSDTSFVNQLLSIGVEDSVNFGDLGVETVSGEVKINITNFGNVMLNLSFSGYGLSEEDGYCMSCQFGDIPIEYQKYNVSSSNSGSLDLAEFEGLYSNLTSLPEIRKINLNYLQEELGNNARNSTYWRVFVPSGIGGTCSGNIVVGAVVGGEL